MASSNSKSGVKYKFTSFIGPGVLIIMGIVFALIAIYEVPVISYNEEGEKIEEFYKQDKAVLHGSLLMILVGIVWLLFVINIIKSYLSYGILTLLFGIAIYTLYVDYMLIKTEFDDKNRKELVFTEIKGRMNDVKEAQKIFKKEKGYYTPNTDELADFIKNGKTVKSVAKGILPNRKLTREEADFIYGKKSNIALDNNMTDVEAKVLLKMPVIPADLNGFVRDTIYVPVMEVIQSYVKTRNKKLTLDFHADSLKYIPFSGKPVLIDTASITRGELTIPTILIQMPHSVDEEFTHTIGDLKENTLKDNWSIK